MTTERYEVVIGLEVHAQLKSRSKIFSAASTEFGGNDNAHVNYQCAGLPGTLPLLNQSVIDLAIVAGLALGAEVQPQSQFVRKQYFYPDLPKGYQISQEGQEICKGGEVHFYDGEELISVPLKKAHLEEDAGKSTHHGTYSLINLNRAGTPLLEIVTLPVIESPRQAALCARAVRQLLQYVDVCDGNLEEGSLRCDCNISLRPMGQKELGQRVELKNINSFRFIEKALEYEVQRQKILLEEGKKVIQETRLYDSTKNVTTSMRKKEDTADYRFFPDPDLPTLLITKEHIHSFKKRMPERPLEKQKRFMDQYGLKLPDVLLLCEDIELAEYFERVVTLTKEPVKSLNWMQRDLLSLLKENQLSVSQSKVSAKDLSELILLEAEGKISNKMAQEVLQNMWNTQKSPAEIVKERGLEQISDPGQLDEVLKSVLERSEKQIEQYISGKDKIFSYFVGQMMKETKGQASPEIVTKLLKSALEKRKTQK